MAELGHTKLDIEYTQDLVILEAVDKKLQTMASELGQQPSVDKLNEIKENLEAYKSSAPMLVDRLGLFAFKSRTKQPAISEEIGQKVDKADLVERIDALLVQVDTALAAAEGNAQVHVMETEADDTKVEAILAQLEDEEAFMSVDVLRKLTAETIRHLMQKITALESKQAAAPVPVKPLPQLNPTPSGTQTSLEPPTATPEPASVKTEKASVFDWLKGVRGKLEKRVFSDLPAGASVERRQRGVLNPILEEVFGKGVGAGELLRLLELKPDDLTTAQKTNRKDVLYAVLILAQRQGVINRLPAEAVSVESANRYIELADRMEVAINKKATGMLEIRLPENKLNLIKLWLRSKKAVLLDIPEMEDANTTSTTTSAALEPQQTTPLVDDKDKKSGDTAGDKTKNVAPTNPERPKTPAELVNLVKEELQKVDAGDLNALINTYERKKLSFKDTVLGMRAVMATLDKVKAGQDLPADFSEKAFRAGITPLVLAARSEAFHKKIQGAPSKADIDKVITSLPS